MQQSNSGTIIARESTYSQLGHSAVNAKQLARADLFIHPFPEEKLLHHVVVVCFGVGLLALVT